MLSLIFSNPISEAMEMQMTKGLHMSPNAFTLKVMDFLLENLSNRKMNSNYLLV